MGEPRYPAPLIDQLAQDEERDILEYPRIVWQHKWSILALTLLAGVWGLFLAYSQVPIYQSTATLLLEPQRNNVVNIKEVYREDTRRNFYIDSQVKILRSRMLAERVMSKLKLDAPLASAPEPQEDSSSLLSIDWSGWLSEQLHKLGGAAPSAPSPEEARRTALINQFLGRLTIIDTERSMAVEIKYRSPDRVLAAQVANAVGETYIESELEAKLQMTSQANVWLMERLGGLREKLRASELALQEFLEHEDIVAVSGSSTLTEQQMQETNQQLNSAKKLRNELKLALDQVRSFEGDDLTRLSSVPAVMNDQIFSSLRQEEDEAQRQLEALSKRYGPKHPSMVRAELDRQTAQKNIRNRLELIVGGLQDEFRIAEANVAALQKQFNTAAEALRDVNRKGHELSILEREVTTNRDLYDRFLNRFKETSESGDLDKVDARIIDPAVAELRPIKPDKQRILAISLLIGLSLGVGIALLLDQLDKTLKHPSDIEERLFISPLSGIPQVKLALRKGETPLSHARENRSSFFAESIRTLRTGVLLSSLDSDKKVIVVTSSVPGEGKSTVASNLAHSIGDMERVLLIDADMRRPTVGKQWGLAKDATGLSEFVAQTAKLSDCLYPIENSLVSVMPSGAVPPNPLELLSSQRFVMALEKLSASFRYIIIDSAPTMAVSDALILSSHASGVVYVIKACSTPYPLAREGIKRLSGAKAHIVGGVLNGVPMDSKGKYYGRYRYLGQYHKGYYGSYGYSKEST